MIDPSTSKDVFGTSEDSEEFNGFSKEEIKMASSQKSRRLRQKAKETSSISVRSEIQRPSFPIGGAEDRPKTSISKPTTDSQAKKDSKQKNSESTTTARKSPCKSNIADLDVETTISLCPLWILNPIAIILQTLVNQQKYPDVCQNWNELWKQLLAMLVCWSQMLNMLRKRT